MVSESRTDAAVSERQARQMRQLALGWFPQLLEETVDELVERGLEQARRQLATDPLEDASISSLAAAVIRRDGLRTMRGLPLEPGAGAPRQARSGLSRAVPDESVASARIRFEVGPAPGGEGGEPETAALPRTGRGIRSAVRRAAPRRHRRNGGAPARPRRDGGSAHAGGRRERPAHSPRRQPRSLTRRLAPAAAAALATLIAVVLALSTGGPAGQQAPSASAPSVESVLASRPAADAGGEVESRRSGAARRARRARAAARARRAAAERRRRARSRDASRTAAAGTGSGPAATPQAPASGAPTMPPPSSSAPAAPAPSTPTPASPGWSGDISP